MVVIIYLFWIKYCLLIKLLLGCTFHYMAHFGKIAKNLFIFFF